MNFLIKTLKHDKNYLKKKQTNKTKQNKTKQNKNKTNHHRQQQNRGVQSHNPQNVKTNMSTREKQHPLSEDNNIISRTFIMLRLYKTKHAIHVCSVLLT